MEPLVYTGPVAGFACRGYIERFIQEWHCASACLLLVALLERLGQVEKRIEPCAFAHGKVSQMRAERSHEMERVESL